MNNKKYFLILIPLLFILFKLSFKKEESLNRGLSKNANQVFESNKKLSNSKIENKSKKILGPTLYKDFNKIIKHANIFMNSSESLPLTYKFLRDLGAHPGIAVENSIGEVKILGTSAVGKARYFFLQYAFDKSPQAFGFEIEPESKKEIYEEIVSLVKENNTGSKVCSESKESIVLRKGSFLIFIKRVTEEQIKEGHLDKPRSLEDVGSVEVSYFIDHHPERPCGSDA